MLALPDVELVSERVGSQSRWFYLELVWIGTNATRKGAMAKIDPTKLWALNYRLVSSVIVDVAAEVADLNLEVKELFLLGAMDESPYPAELAGSLCIPK